MPVSVKGRCYCLADVNVLYGYGRCYSQEVDGIPLLFEWQMLLPFLFWQIFYMLQYIATVILADVIAMWQMVSPLLLVLF